MPNRPTDQFTGHIDGALQGGFEGVGFCGDRRDPIQQSRLDFRSLAIGNVPQHADENNIFSDLYLFHREFQREQLPILPHALHLQGIANHLGRPGWVKPFQVVVMLQGDGFGHQYLDVLADHLCRAIAENGFRRLVECLDRSFPVDGHDAIGTRFDDRGNALFARLDFSPRLDQLALNRL